MLCVGRLLRESAGGQSYANAQNARVRLRARYDAAFADVDVLAMPTAPTTARAITSAGSVFERLTAHLFVTVNTAPFDLTGHPSLSVPCGEVDGLPVGLMLTGRRFEDARLLGAGAVLES
jgi:amidase